MRQGRVDEEHAGRGFGASDEVGFAGVEGLGLPNEIVGEVEGAEGRVTLEGVHEEDTLLVINVRVIEREILNIDRVTAEQIAEGLRSFPVHVIVVQLKMNEPVHEPCTFKDGDKRVVRQSVIGKEQLGEVLEIGESLRKGHTVVISDAQAGEI